MPFTITCSELFAAARFFAEWEGTCFLYSGGNGDAAETSFLALFPYETIEVRGDTSTDPWEELQHFFSALPPQAIAFGWLGYGMGASADREKKLPYRGFR